MADARSLALVPFHFWSVVFFVFGSLAGSFLNVCIYRLPRGESVVWPPSHCPHCNYRIPWYLNLPLFTWLYLRGRCANCGAPISFRYWAVELLTALLFLGCWLQFGSQSTWQAIAGCVLLAGFVVATFIDFEHFIIPDEITLGGMAAGFIFSFVAPPMHGVKSAPESLQASFWGMVMGAAVIYALVRIGKLLFGRHTLTLAPDSTVVFTDTALQLPDQEIPYGDLLYRKSDRILLQAKKVVLGDRQWENVAVTLSPSRLRIGEEEMDPEPVTRMEVTADAIELPREAMGLGDVKFMAAIGAFIGWPGVVFTLLVSSALGAAVGITLILLRKRDWGHIPYGPYLAVAATIWMFGGHRLGGWWLQLTRPVGW